MLESYDDALDLVAQWRDQHCKQAADWQRLFEHYRQTGDTANAMDASSMINQNNFAVGSLSQLLGRLEQRGRPVKIEGR